MRLIYVVALVSALLSACGEPFREEGKQYTDAAINALEPYRIPSEGRLPFDGPYWNDCGRQVTCILLYGTTDEQLVKQVVLSLREAQARIKKPGVKLTVYSSMHGQSKVVFREVTIE